MPPEGNHTGERVAPKVRQEIVKLLAQDKSANHIAKKLYVSRHTVGAIKVIEAQSIAQRKQTLTSSFLRIAEAGAEQIEEQLAEGKISANLLVPVTGMATDKILALSGDPSIIIRHEHDHRHIHVDLANDFDSFLSELPATNHEAKALPVLDAEESVSCAPKEQKNNLQLPVELTTITDINGSVHSVEILGSQVFNSPCNASPEPATP